MLLGPILQNAYVTRDIDRACTYLANSFGMREFLRIGATQIEIDDGETMTLKMAHAWIGATWLEIIEPVGGAVSLYRGGLPADDAPLKFHHVGIRLPDQASWDRTVQDAEANGLNIALILTKNWDNKFVFYDTVNTLGHHIEYMLIPDQDKSLMTDMPQNLDQIFANTDDLACCRFGGHQDRLI